MTFLVMIRLEWDFFSHLSKLFGYQLQTLILFFKLLMTNIYETKIKIFPFLQFKYFILALELRYAGIASVMLYLSTFFPSPSSSHSFRNLTPAPGAWWVNPVSKTAKGLSAR